MSDLLDYYREHAGAEPVALEKVAGPLQDLHDAREALSGAEQAIEERRQRVERTEELLEERRQQAEDASAVGVTLSAVEGDVATLEEALEEHKVALEEARQQRTNAQATLEDAKEALRDAGEEAFAKVEEEAEALIRQLAERALEIRFLTQTAGRFGAEVRPLPNALDDLRRMFTDLKARREVQRDSTPSLGVVKTDRTEIRGRAGLERYDDSVLSHS